MTDRGLTMDSFSNLFDEKNRMKIHNGMRYYKRNRIENNMIRFTVCMAEPVDKQALEKALTKILPRFPLMGMRVVADAHRYYLQPSDTIPLVYENDGSRHVAGGNQNNGCLLRVGYRDREITFDFFHGIHDGGGILVFLKSLLYQYCHMRYGVSPCGITGLILPGTPMHPEEMMDCMLFVPKEPVSYEASFKWETAFALPDAMTESPDVCHEYTLTVDADAMRTFMQTYNCSVSTAFSLLINKIIADKNGIGDLPIVAAMAVNARPAYHAEHTLQCCVGTVPVYYTHSMQSLSLQEQLSLTADMIHEGADAAALVSSAQKNRIFNQRLEETCQTLAEKQAYCDQLAKRAISRYTYGISYVGKCDFGDSIDRHVDTVRVGLSANTTPILVEITKCGHRYILTWMTRLQNDPYVKALQDLLATYRVPCTCKQREDFRECIALFDGEILLSPAKTNETI